MSVAATVFLDSLSPELRSKATFDADSHVRADWHFVPRERAGVALKDLSETQRVAAFDLLRSALSSRGMLKVHGVLSLEQVLHDAERSAGGDGSGRDPGKYHLAVFGTPGAATWGWRFEGHHVSLHFDGANHPAARVDGAHSPRFDDAVSTTPMFFGTSPAEVRSGPHTGLRVLAEEEDLARSLMNSLTVVQMKQAIIAERAPPDVVLVPGRDFAAAPPAGISYTDLTGEQQETLRRIVREIAGNLRHELEHTQLARMERAGWDKTRFAWAGSTDRGKGHYYRVTGPTFVMEYDNTQNDANHVHVLWRDPEHDFGRDLLKEHVHTEHAPAR
jgi:hypothetical protein